jgi:DNA gyrase subunit A
MSEENKKDNENLFDSEERTRDIIKNISDQMEDKYLDYAMSVIVSRALPDVRDGMKPVHRRILYAMKSIGLTSSASFSKSASVVGEVLGKYHPHGDSAVYDSMVRMAQDFSMRYMLVNGQGNFGSIDGDNAAAMRYTEAKMESISELMLADIDKDTVDFKPNYDGKHKEPTVLPTRIPQLLLNGVMGIAVAMATSIPPHHLGEVCKAMLHLMENPDSTIDDLMEFLKGPDFPTGGIIYDTDAIKKMYATGRGGITVRAKTQIEDIGHGKSAIIVTEIPYQVNKASLVQKIAQLVRDKKVTDITDLRDESNREGIRVVIELKRDAYPKKVLNTLFKMTPLQTRFNMNMIALVDGIQPRLLNLKQVLNYFIDHRKEVVERRTRFELGKAEARAHILEGLKIALDNIDEVIATIRASETKEVAQTALMEKFKLSELQAKAILDMRLQTLAGLERKKIEDELAQLLELIADLKDILAKPERIIAIIKEETEEILEKYNDERRTKIVPHGLGKIKAIDTVPNEPMIVTLTENNYIKRMPLNTFKAQNRGGKGVSGLSMKDDDQVKLVEFAHNHDHVLFFTNFGKVFSLRLFEIPQASRTAKGTNIVNLLELGRDEYVTSVLTVHKNVDREGKYLLMCTENGTVKKTDFEQFSNVRKSGLIAIKLKDGDSLKWVKQVEEGQEVMIVTQKGKSIRFDQDDVRPMGRSAQGVRGIKIKSDDKVVEMDILSGVEGEKLFVIMENGMGKSSMVSDYRTQNRGGSGVKTANLSAKTGDIVGAMVLKEGSKSDLLFLSKLGQALRMSTDNIPTQGRSTKGVYLMRMKAKDDAVTSFSVLPDKEQLEEQTKQQMESLFEEEEKKEKTEA